MSGRAQTQKKKSGKQQAKKGQRKPAAAKRQQAKRQTRNPKRAGRQNSNRAMMPVGPGPSGRIGLQSGRSGNATTRRAQFIEEDEYIQDVNGSTSFATTAFACNPGQAGVFPWGSKVSSLYSEYEFEYLEFYYKREVSEFATNGQAGKVMLSFDYDATDPAPLTKQQVEDSVPHQDGMPCVPLIRLPIDCARLRANLCKFVRPGAQLANTDLKTYDAGNLFVSTYGNTNTSNIGELRVRYRLKLSEPILTAIASSGGAVHFSSVASTTANNFANAVLQAGATPALSGITWVRIPSCSLQVFRATTFCL